LYTTTKVTNKFKRNLYPQCSKCFHPSAKHLLYR